MSSPQERKRAISGALMRLECLAHGEAANGAAVECAEMIGGHEVTIRISAPSRGTCRTYWRLNGDRRQRRTLERFLLAEAGREVAP